MDNILDTAESSLGGLVAQRDMLKGVKQKMMAMFEQLGMSQTVIRLIGKRADQETVEIFHKFKFIFMICFIQNAKVEITNFLTVLQDKLVLWGGMAITTLILFIIWKYYA